MLKIHGEASLVTKAIQDLPEEFVARLDNIDVVVQDFSTTAQSQRSGIGRRYSLLGLYEGFHVTRLQARRAINSRADRRGADIEEAMIRNYR